MLVARLATVMPDAEGCMFSPDSGGGSLVAVCATPAVRDAVTALRIPIGEGLAGWVAANRHTIINSHADLDLGATTANRLGLKACTAMPVFALGDLAGVLSVYLPPSRRFSDADVRAVGALAQEIGLVIARQTHAFGGESRAIGPSADARALAS
jgi:GAF domain-containing protein